MKTVYYIILSLICAVFLFTLYGALEGPAYSRKDTWLWIAWAISSGASIVVLAASHKKLFAMPRKNAIYLILAILFTMFLIIDLFYVYIIITSDIVLKSKINQTLLLLALTIVTSLFYYLYNHKRVSNNKRTR